MANKQLRSLGTAFVALALSFGAVVPSSAQDNPRQARRVSVPPPTLNPGRQAPLCNVVLEVKATDPEANGHLKVGQRLQLMGPIPPQGHMLVSPTENPMGPPHEWRPGVHVAHRLGNAGDPLPWQFFLRVPVLSIPDHPQVEQHHYLMTVTAVDDLRCPSNVEFDTLPHEGEIIDDHPGHANLD